MTKKWWQKEWDPIGALVAQVSKSPTASEKEDKNEPPKTDTPADLKDLEKKGLLGKFYRHWKDPAFKKQLQAVAERMKADGVNVKDQNAVKTWVEAHQKEIESGSLPPAGASKVETFVKSGPSVGRNEPCPCGSGKKYKKCCLKKAG